MNLSDLTKRHLDLLTDTSPFRLASGSRASGKTSMLTAKERKAFSDALQSKPCSVIWIEETKTPARLSLTRSFARYARLTKRAERHRRRKALQNPWSFRPVTEPLFGPAMMSYWDAVRSEMLKINVTPKQCMKPIQESTYPDPDPDRMFDLGKCPKHSAGPGLSIMKLATLWIFNSKVGMFGVRAEHGPILESALERHDSSGLPSGPFAVWVEPIMGGYEEACYRAWGIVRNPYHTLTGEMTLHLMLGLTTPEKILRLVAPDQLPPPFDPANITITPILNPNETMTSHTPCPHCGRDLLWSDDRGAHCDGCDDFDPADTTITPIIMTPKTTQEPRTIQHDGKTYRLHQKAHLISADPPLSEGPFYSLDGVDPQDWAFMPDRRFLAGLSSTPSFMHCMQQRAAVATPRPA